MSEKIYLNKEEQIFLMEMLEFDNPEEAVGKFIELMVKEKADPGDIRNYIRKIMKKKLNGPNRG